MSSLHTVSVVSGVLLSIILISFICFIPQHDILEEPYYWYEFMILEAFVQSPMQSACRILSAAHFANITYANNLISFFTLSAIRAIIFLFLYSCYYFVWVYALELYAPLPGGGIFLNSILSAVLCLLLWFRYDYRDDHQWSTKPGKYRTY